VSDSSILVVDAGTSALRAVVVAASGETTTLAREPWSTFTPDDAAPFGRELNSDSVRASIQRALDSAAPTKASLAGIAFTGQREGLVFTDGDGEPLLISPNVDARASAEGTEIDTRHGDAVYRATGHLPSLIQAPAKLAWMRTHRPEDAARIRHALPLSDWLAFTLTGERVASRSLLAENGLLDMTSEKAWSPPGSEESLRDITGAQRPDGACAGRVSHGACAGLAVIVAGADTQCALVGASAVKPGDAAVAAGWSAPVQLVTASPLFDAEMRTWTGVHVAPNRWVVESNAGETGRVWEWLLSMLGLPASEADALAATSPAGAHDVMTVLGPPRMKASAMNAGVGGITLPLPLVMSAPDRADVLRSTLESIAFAIRANLEQAEEVAGASATELRLAGGMSRSEIFARTLADVIDRPVWVASTPETTALGAAALAAPALGVQDSFDRALEAMVRPATVVEPDTASAAAYDDIYGRWLATCETFESMP
jgi:autoinducer 2 (AI-2) kinase